VAHLSTPDLSALAPLASELATTIARVASDIALVIDGDGIIRTVAENTAPLSSTCGDWVGQHWVDTATAGTRRKIEMLLQEVSTTGITRRREVNHPGQGGDDIPVTWAAIRLGEGGAVLAVGRDLRAVAAIQQRLVDAQQDMERQFWSRRQAENRYRLLFQVASDGVLVLDAASLQVLEANAAAVALLGPAAGVAGGASLPDGLPTSARAAVLELLTSARTTGRAGEIRVRALQGSGALDISATPFRADDKQHMLVRARQDDAAAMQGPVQVTMAEFIESTPDAVVITDSAGRVLMANPAFVQLTQRDHEAQVQGLSLRELLGDADGAWMRLVARVLAAGIVSHTALAVQSAGLASHTVDATGALLTEGEQACLGFTLRPGQPAHPAPQAHDLQGNLADLVEQVGRVPLTDLLAEIVHRSEKQLIAAALQRAGGSHAMTAELLGLTTDALGLRLQRHGLSGQGFLFGPDGPPPSIN